MLTFITNLFSVLKNVPAAITILKAIMDIIGSETVKAILDVILKAVQQSKTTDTPVDQLPPQERKRFIERISQRVAQKLLGWNDSQMSVAMNAFADPENTAEFTA